MQTYLINLSCSTQKVKQSVKTWIIKIHRLRAKLSKAIGNVLNVELKSLKCLFSQTAPSQSFAVIATEARKATDRREAAHLAAHAKHFKATGNALNAELKSLKCLFNRTAPSQFTAEIATEAKEADFNLNKLLFD